MDILNQNLETLNAASGYRFSATKIGDLGAAEYTVVTVVVDTSSSVYDFGPQLEQALKTIFKSCEKSPRRDNLMLRVTQFNDQLNEIHGFKLFSGIKEDDYTGVLNIGGMTALFDAADEAIQATGTYGKQLTDQDFLVNGIVFVITDGANNRGAIMDPAPVKKSIERVRKSESLESLTTILIGVTNDDNDLDAYLRDVNDNCGFDQYVSIGKATPGRCARLAAFVSQSISSTSASLGTGAASQPINPASFNF